MPTGGPLIVLSKGEQGKSVQLANIEAGKTVADVIRTCLGPRAMLKMLMDPMGGIVMTNDGNAILREITVEHPAAKSMIEIARTQDEEVGDGTTSVVKCWQWLFMRRKSYPHSEVVLMICFIPCDITSESEVLKIIKSCVGTKFINQWYIMMAAKKSISNIPGGSTEDSVVLDGVMFNKDVVHPRMARRIENPRILLMDCNLEYKKGESQTTMEISDDKDFTRALEIEESCIKEIDLAQHFLSMANISVIRRLRKTDNMRIARASGATIVNRPEEIKEEDIGLEAGLFEVKTIGEEYYTFITKCKNAKACTIILRGASKDVLNEVERNLQDAMSVARNVMLEQRLVPGGGAIEMALAQELTEKSKTVDSAVQQMVYLAMAQALEVIPRTLAKNCGANVLRLITELRARHATDPVKYWTWGVDGETGRLADMKDLKVWDPLAVKSQTLKTAIETAILLLRIDDVVSGLTCKQRLLRNSFE
ncbi:unnamed protein product [Trichobilharzia regenti]|nr:unnamed protein product [Trichobilharzia regenti]